MFLGFFEIVTLFLELIYRKNNDTQIFEKLTLLQKNLNLAMDESKDTYYSNLSTKTSKTKI